MHDPALFATVQSVVERSVVIPFQIVKEFTQLILDNVEVPAVRVIVPQINDLKIPLAVVHEENRMKLLRPYSRYWVAGF